MARAARTNSPKFSLNELNALSALEQTVFLRNSTTIHFSILLDKEEYAALVIACCNAGYFARGTSKLVAHWIRVVFV